ncbi:hypothetical protein DITRI_Ditri16bG0101900 [Diplodiscus trichospermus]
MDRPFLSEITEIEEVEESTEQSPSHRSTDYAITPDITNPKSPTNLNKKREIPSFFTHVREAFQDCQDKEPTTPCIVGQAFIWLVFYISTGIFIYLTSASFKGIETSKPVDALYFIVVTLCTIGYGDIVPDTTFTKIFTCFFILIGIGFIDVLLNGLVKYICDRHESVLLSTVDENRFNTMIETLLIDKEKRRMRIRMKVALALVVVVVCIAIGTVAVHFLENLDWVDSFYLSVTSVTTVGYGDIAFTTLKGRCFAILWLLLSTFAVARAFLFLTELRIEKRNRRIVKRVLQTKTTPGDLVAGDLDNKGSISKSEFVICKLKEMGKIEENDILQICNQFDALDNCGKMTAADVMHA